MKLATLAEGGRDGTLVVVSRNGDRFCHAGKVAPTLQAAIENWSRCEPELRALAARLDDEPGETLLPSALASPLPRAWQWLDGSAFASHAELMQTAFGLPPLESDRPLMYQGMSHCFIAPMEDVPLPSEQDGIDFEGEFGVITNDVLMGTSPEQALDHIRLLVQINDWSLRAIAPIEMKTGFGWIQAKPACSMAPFAVTPDELGAAWRDGRVCLDLFVDWNGSRFGHANGAAMAFGFHDLIAHAARTRSLPAGTIIGSGTVSNPNFREVGSSCISERRGIEMIDRGEAHTGFMLFGDTIRMEARTLEGNILFGAIDQRVIKAEG